MNERAATGRAFVLKYREVLIAAAAGLLGLFIATRGGWFLAAVGLALVALAIGWGISALRQIRFRRDIEAPGMVEIVEGRIGYFGAGTVMGGHIALDDMAEIRLITLRSGLWWRLRTLDGQALLIPLGASGAEALYDAFSSLPGIDMGRVTAALDGGAVAQSLWVRPMLREVPAD